MSDKKEFGQLGDITKDTEGTKKSNNAASNLEEKVKAGFGKFEKMSNEEREEYLKKGLGKLEGNSKKE
ncbi:unnamed protein product [Candida verbasci]|uniref:Uncharacterized protein n=1 Tax=Candida verbasci TaxID=1227364 RepID=A0A9W4XGV9_9ASCO|nr:unnamed protein product [Candida verbasci]